MAAVETVQHDGWAEIVLNRPEVKNAIDGPFGIALAQSLLDASADTDNRVLLLRGAGGAFCSGLDLNAFNAEPAPAWLSEFQAIWRAAHRALFETPMPVVGALERYAINGGAALALACDLLVVGEASFLQVGEAQIGMAAPYNLAWMSLRHSEALMAEVALQGERIRGEALVGLGIAQHCVEDGQVLETAQQLCDTLAGYPDGGLRRIKAGLRARLSVDADGWFDRFTGVDPVGSRPKPRRMQS